MIFIREIFIMVTAKRKNVNRESKEGVFLP